MTPVLKPVNPATATGKTKELFDAIKHRLKRVPGMIRLMANSPAILDTYLHFNEAFEHTTLTPRLHGLITVAVSEINACDYTLSAGRPQRVQKLLQPGRWHRDRLSRCANEPRDAGGPTVTFRPSRACMEQEANMTQSRRRIIPVLAAQLGVAMMVSGT